MFLTIPDLLLLQFKKVLTVNTRLPETMQTAETRTSRRNCFRYFIKYSIN